MGVELCGGTSEELDGEGENTRLTGTSAEADEVRSCLTGTSAEADVVRFCLTGTSADPNGVRGFVFICISRFLGVV